MKDLNDMFEADKMYREREAITPDDFRRMFGQTIVGSRIWAEAALAALVALPEEREEWTELFNEVRDG